jgi:anaphase-promoting complex subunit 8
VQYFSRAVRLNPKFLSAYILMGHEYMEMKNIPAAVRAYRKAAGSPLFILIYLFIISII